TLSPGRSDPARPGPSRVRVPPAMRRFRPKRGGRAGAIAWSASSTLCSGFGTAARGAPSRGSSRMPDALRPATGAAPTPARTRGPSRAPEPLRLAGEVSPRSGSPTVRLPEPRRDETGDLVREGRDRGAGFPESGNLALGGPLASGDDRPGVPHPLPGRSGAPGHVRDDGLAEPVSEVIRRVLLGRPADLPHQHDEVGVGILL